MECEGFVKELCECGCSSCGNAFLMWCSKINLRCLLVAKFDKEKLFFGEVSINRHLCLKIAYIVMHSELGRVGKLDKWSISDKLKKDLLGLIQELS